jgi:hypothetical protein
MALRPGQAKGPSVSPSGSGGGSITVPTSVPTWFPCIDFDFTQFNGTAATTLSIALFSLLPRMSIEAMVVKTSVAFVGAGLTSLNFTVGLTGDLARYLSPYSGLAVVSGVNFASSDTLRVENFLAATSILLSAVSIGANLNVITAGHGCVWVKGALLPSP